ncbi:hypothetical protein MTO96_013237 [Rhipicephalus appendiculatus]
MHVYIRRREPCDGLKQPLRMPAANLHVTARLFGGAAECPRWKRREKEGLAFKKRFLARCRKAEAEEERATQRSLIRAAAGRRFRPI